MFQIQTAAEWDSDARHQETLEIDLGVHWMLGPEPWPHWRVSWIQATGELYARELGGRKRYAVLGNFATRAEVDAALYRLTNTPGAMLRAA